MLANAEPISILEVADQIVSVEEACAFQRKIDKRLTYSQLRFFVCQNFDHRVIDGETMLKQLWDGGLIRDADDLAFLVSAGVRALTEREVR